MITPLVILGIIVITYLILWLFFPNESPTVANNVPLTAPDSMADLRVYATSSGSDLPNNLRGQFDYWLGFFGMMIFLVSIICVPLGYYLHRKEKKVLP